MKLSLMTIVSMLALITLDLPTSKGWPKLKSVLSIMSIVRIMKMRVTVSLILSSHTVLFGFLVTYDKMTELKINKK